jgi:hypothetical protein
VGAKRDIDWQGIRRKDRGPGRVVAGLQLAVHRPGSEKDDYSALHWAFRKRIHTKQLDQFDPQSRLLSTFTHCRILNAFVSLNESGWQRPPPFMRRVPKSDENHAALCLDEDAYARYGVVKQHKTTCRAHEPRAPADKFFVHLLPTTAAESGIGLGYIISPVC